MVKSGTMVIGAGIILALAYAISKAGAAPITTQGTLDIVSCPQNVSVSPGSSASISVVVQALNGNASQTLMIVAGSYADSQLVTLGENQITTVAFTIPNVMDTIQYTVNAI